MVMHLRAGAAMPDKERLAGQIGPGDGGLPGEWISLRQRGHERFGPYRARMAVGHFGRAGHEYNVKPGGAKLHDRIAGRAFGDLDIDAGVVFPIPTNQTLQEAAGNQGVDSYAQTTAFSLRRHASGFHGMIELVDAGRDLLHELPACFGQPDAAGVALEQEGAKFVLKRLHTGTDAGLADPKCAGRVAKIQMFCDSECLN